MRYDKYTAPDGSTYAQPSGNGNMKLADFINMACEATTLSRADIKAVCAALEDFLPSVLGAGRTLQLPGIGTFGISLRLPQDADERELDGRDVKLGRVTFRAAPALKAGIAQCITSVERVEPRLRREKHPVLPPSQRRAAAVALATEGEFTVRQYRAATNASRPQASRDLTSLVADGTLSVRHLGTACLYSLPPNVEEAGANG